eukprot:scpid20013/ scgid26233/ Ras and EF-hand domain-containing protein homolog
MLDHYNVDPSCELLEKLLREDWHWPKARVRSLLQLLSPQQRHAEEELEALFLTAVEEESREVVARGSLDGKPVLGASASARRLSPFHGVPAGEEHRRHSADATHRSAAKAESFKVKSHVQRRASDMHSGTESELDTYFPALKGHGDLLLLWDKLRLTRPELLDPFSSFLDTVSQQLQDAELQRERMSTDLQRETRDLDRRAQELDEEATNQIETERHRLRMQEEDRLRRLRDEMIREIEERESKLDVALRHVNGLQSKVEQLSQKEKQMETRCEELQQVRSTLETELQFQQIRQEELKAQIESSGHDSPSRSQSRLSESDNEVLQKQLDHLRRMNNDLKRQLQDRVDELVATEQSKRHDKVADGKQASTEKWYESEEDWSTPFKGKAIHKTKRGLRGALPLYTSDDDTDASPMRLVPGRRHRARGIEIGSRQNAAYMQARQLQSPVPLAMDRFLRRKSTTADSDADSDDGGRPLGVQYTRSRLTHALVEEASESDATSRVQLTSSTVSQSQSQVTDCVDGRDTDDTASASRVSPESVFKEEGASTVDPASVQTHGPPVKTVRSQRSADRSKGNSPERTTEKRHLQMGTTPTAATHDNSSSAGVKSQALSRSMSSQFTFSGQPTAHQSEPESASKRMTRHSSIQQRVQKQDKMLLSDGDHARASWARRFQHSAPASTQSHSYQEETSQFASPVLPQTYSLDYSSPAHYSDGSRAAQPVWSSDAPTSGRPVRFHSSLPVSPYGLSPSMRRRYSPATPSTAHTTPSQSIGWEADGGGDDRVSLRSFKSLIEEHHESSSTDNSLTSTPGPTALEREMTNMAVHQPASNESTQPFKRTRSLQPHGGGAHMRGKKKRRKLEEVRVHPLTSVEPQHQQHQQPAKQLSALESLNDAFSRQEKNFPVGAVSMPAPRSHLRSSSSDEQNLGRRDSQGEAVVQSKLTRDGPRRESVGNLSLMELTAEEQAAPGKPEAMPVVVHPIQATTPQYQTRQRPVSPSVARRVGIMPERVFKVILCGDAGVGKTSYIWRLCNTSADYAGEFKSTVGVDYKMKVLEVDGHVTVLQLWDTAGQERYRTFTKQYFRKADGVICVYDINNHSSFVQLKEWLQEIENAADGNVALMILGNKYDAADGGTRPKRQVTYWQGQQQAQRAGALFAEVSAKSGHGVLETCIEMAKVLYSAEEEIITDLLTLSPGQTPVKKKEKSCCS